MKRLLQHPRERLGAGLRQQREVDFEGRVKESLKGQKWRGAAKGESGMSPRFLAGATERIKMLFKMGTTTKSSDLGLLMRNQEFALTCVLGTQRERAAGSRIWESGIQDGGLEGFVWDTSAGYVGGI